jgi:hypothetical protein
MKCGGWLVSHHLAHPQSMLFFSLFSTNTRFHGSVLCANDLYFFGTQAPRHLAFSDTPHTHLHITPPHHPHHNHTTQCHHCCFLDTTRPPLSANTINHHHSPPITTTHTPLARFSHTLKIYSLSSAAILFLFLSSPHLSTHTTTYSNTTNTTTHPTHHHHTHTPTSQHIGIRYPGIRNPLSLF